MLIHVRFAPEADPCDWSVDRVEVPAERRLSLLKDCFVERGTKEDWYLLHELHYKAEQLPFGPLFYRCVMGTETIGVGVFGMSSMVLAPRNEIFPQMKPNQHGGKDGKIINKHRINNWNARARTNSRLVLDTMYRGAGIAYRMQNLMMRQTGFEVIEFQSSMSQFNPFAARAGVRFARPRRAAKYEEGMAMFRRWFESTPSDFVGVKEEYDRMPESMRKRADAEFRLFYYRNSSKERTGNSGKEASTRVAEFPFAYILKQVQQLVLAKPMYGVYLNPDHTRELPARIPLLAFDNQRPDEPLRLDLL